METEVQWRPVVGYEGFYEVSDTGRIRAVDRIVNGRRYQSREVKVQKLRTGYSSVRLYKAGIGKTFTVHRMVAKAFIPNTKNKLCVNHKDGNKNNNVVSNLEWLTHEENNKHAHANGLNYISEKNMRAKIEASAKVRARPVIRMGKGLPNKEYPSIKAASQSESVSGSDITQVCKGRNKSAGGFKWKYKTGGK